MIHAIGPYILNDEDEDVVVVVVDYWCEHAEYQ